MIYAFDWGGTYNVNPALWDLVDALLECGHEVHIISIAWPHEKRREHIQEWTEKTGTIFTKVHIIWETGHTQHGVEKVKIMKQINAGTIFDDNQDVINHARAAGFLALKVPYKDH
jgi:hypothetical protein